MTSAGQVCLVVKVERYKCVRCRPHRNDFKKHFLLKRAIQTARGRVSINETSEFKKKKYL